MYLISYLFCDLIVIFADENCVNTQKCICMKFEREHYIKKLISSKHNHLIKIVTGLRRVGKSYLLFNLYKQHLLDNCVDTSHIIEIQLDSFAHRKYRKAETLYEYVENLTKQDSQMYYVIILNCKVF